MKRTPPPPPTRKNQAPTNRPKPVPSESIEVEKQQQNSDPSRVLTQQMAREQVLNSVAEQTVSSPNQQPFESVAQQAMPEQAIEQPPVDQQFGQPSEKIQETQSPATFPGKSAVRPKAGPPPAKSKATVKGRAPPPPPKTIPRNSPPKDILKIEEKMNISSPPEPQIEETEQTLQGQSQKINQNVIESQNIPYKEAEPEKEVIPSRIEVPIKKSPALPPTTKANNNKGKRLPPQGAFTVPPQQQLQLSEIQLKEPQSQPEQNYLPLETPVKVESHPMSIPRDNSIDKTIEQVAPGSSNSKLYEKMLKLRQAKQEMAKDSDEASEVQEQDAEDEVERQEEYVQNSIKQEVKAFQEEREDKIIQRQVVEVQESAIIAMPPQIQSNKVSPPPKSNRQAPPQKTIPLPIRSAPKSQVKKMQAPPPTTYQPISISVAQQPQPEQQTKQEIRQISQNPIENQSEPNPFPLAPIDSSPKVEHQRPHQYSHPAQPQNPSVTVSLSKSQSPLLSEINSLLDRYHTLKSSYLSNIHDLQEQLNFQKQQEDAQVDKINHLIAQLGKKNKKIKDICIGKTQTLIEEEQIMGSAAV